jgi:ribonucleotide reductase beta subunit family protein with ferritin-like domain
MEGVETKNITSVDIVSPSKEFIDENNNICLNQSTINNDKMNKQNNECQEGIIEEDDSVFEQEILSFRDSFARSEVETQHTGCGAGAGAGALEEKLKIIKSNNNDVSSEMLLRPDNTRYVMFPIKDNDIWKMYKKQIDSFWTVQEVDTSRDLKDWELLSKDEKHFISMVLAFFSSSDGIVMENLASRFMMDVQLAEARAFYGFQIAMENIHSEMYSILIDTYIQDGTTKDNLFNAIDNYPCIAKKANWAKKWISNNRCSFASRLVAFAVVEGIFFSSAFASIYWIKKRGLMPGLTFSNELISRDEALHTEFAILLYSKLNKKLNKKRIYEIIQEAVEIEKMFIIDAIPCRMIGMNSKLMIQYIEFVADRLCIQLGYEKIYKSSNPFDFMELISIEKKVNFFERTNSEYSLANKTKNDDVFNLNAAF